MQEIRRKAGVKTFTLALYILAFKLFFTTKLPILIALEFLKLEFLKLEFLKLEFLKLEFLKENSLN